MFNGYHIFFCLCTNVGNIFLHNDYLINVIQQIEVQPKAHVSWSYHGYEHPGIQQTTYLIQIKRERKKENKFNCLFFYTQMCRVPIPTVSMEESATGILQSINACKLCKIALKCPGFKAEALKSGLSA